MEAIENLKNESVFKNKNFILLFIGMFVSRFGDVIFNFAMGWYILSLTDKQLMSGLFIAIGMITMTIFQMYGGVIADKLNKVKLIYITDFLSGFSLILCFIALLNTQYISNITHISEVNVIITILYISSFLLNFFHALFIPASRSLVPKIVKEHQYQQAQSLSNISMNLNHILGILGGGLLYLILKPNGIILLNGITFIISGFSEMFIKERDNFNEEQNNKVISSFISDFEDAIRYIKKEVGITQLITLAILLNFFLAPLFAVVPQNLFNQVLETSTFEFSIIEIFFSLSAILVSIYLSMKKQPDKVYRYLKNGLIINFVITFLMLGLFYIVLENLISFLPFMIGFCFIMFLFGAIITIVNVPLEVGLMKRIDKKMFGRVIAIFGTFVGLATPISIVIFSFLIDVIGLIYTMSILVFGGIFGIVYLLVNKQLREI